MKHPNGTVTPEIKRMVRRLVRRFQPERIILFGSRARGTATRDSDVDLLVVTNARGKRHEQEIRMLCAVHDIAVPKDIVVTTPRDLAARRGIPGTIERYAHLDGRTLYARGS